MAQLGRLRKKTMSHMNQLQPVMAAGDKIEAQIEPLLAILHHPARQPMILLKMIQGLATALNVVGNTLHVQQTKNGQEEHRKGRYTARMSYIFHKIPLRLTLPMSGGSSSSSGGGGSSPFPDFLQKEFCLPLRHSDDPPIDDIDGAILKWRPGLLTNDEYTPAFEPFKTSTGKRLKRWSNHVLETEYNDKKGPRVEGYRTNSFKIGSNPEDDLENGNIFTIMHRSCPSLKMTARIKKHEVSMVDTAHAVLHEAPSVVIVTEVAKVHTVTELLEMSSVVRAKTILKEMHTNVQPNMCRHVTSELMTGVKDPPSPEEVAAHAKRMARLALREKESGIIVHVMSRYMGMR